MKSGIFFGFKKPLLYYPCEIISSINITGVTARTFNLSISCQDQDSETCTEFSMIDVSEYDGISTYIQTVTIAKTNVKKENTSTDAMVEKEVALIPQGLDEEEDEDFECDDSDSVI